MAPKTGKPRLTDTFALLTPPRALVLPNTLDESIKLANLSNTDLLIAQLDYEIASKDLNIEKSRLSPTASINYSKSENKDDLKFFLDSKIISNDANYDLLPGSGVDLKKFKQKKI